MLDHEDLKWIATTSTELNAILQQVARFSDLARQHKGVNNYIEELGERVELASKKSQALFDRVTNSILAPGANHQALSGRSMRGQPFSVLSAPACAPPPPPALFKPTEKPAETAAGDERAPEQIEIPPEIHVSNPEGTGALIPLVDDEPEICALASEMLCEEGYKVIVAKEGFEALRIYRQIGPLIGLVILDFFLPVMDGDAVFDELRALNPSVDVVLSSGFAEQSKIAAMLAQGLRGFIPKPYTRAKLLEQVRSTLEAAREHAGIRHAVFTSEATKLRLSS